MKALLDRILTAIHTLLSRFESLEEQARKTQTLVETIHAKIDAMEGSARPPEPEPEPASLSHGLLTLTEAGERLGISGTTVRRRIDDGVIRGTTIGVHFYVHEGEVQSLIDNKVRIKLRELKGGKKVNVIAKEIPDQIHIRFALYESVGKATLIFTIGANVLAALHPDLPDNAYVDVWIDWEAKEVIFIGADRYDCIHAAKLAVNANHLTAYTQARHHAADTPEWLRSLDGGVPITATLDGRTATLDLSPFWKETTDE
jgi:excisionase family DNA binding protein